MSKPKQSKSTSRRKGAPTPKTEDVWQREPEKVRRFLAVQRDYEDLCAEVEYILRKRITAKGIETAAIISRSKTLNSFLEKLQRKHYGDPFTEITDLAGARIVCLYRSDIDRIADVIQSEFEVVEDTDKVNGLAVDQFGYTARHFIVRLGKATSGARYDDLKSLSCEVQVRTVLQDAWAIIQHHMVYKRESQAPPEVQRKLNSLAGLLETADDQFERIREERELYLEQVKESSEHPVAFLENALNLDSFRAYLAEKFAGRAVESSDGQIRIVFDGLVAGGLKTLGDLDVAINNTVDERKAILSELEDLNAEDGTVPSNFEAALALALTVPDWQEAIPFSREWKKAISTHRSEEQESG